MNPVDIDERFSKLERENEMLRAEVSALSPKASTLRPPLEPVVKIFHLIAASTFTMPTDSELQRLREIVCAKYPSLGESAGLVWRGSREEDEIEYFSTFKLAFLALGSMRRLESPDRKRYLTHWTDHCEGFLRSIGKWPTLRFVPFMAAVLAHGDIPYSGLFIDGAVIELGINDYSGREARGAWKRVIETGELRAPSQVARPMAPRSPSRVVIGDHAGW